LLKNFDPKPAFSISALQTLSFLVYLQPISERELVQMRGSSTLSDLNELTSGGFVSREGHGKSKVWVSTDKFADSFGLSRNRDQLRREVANEGLLSLTRRMKVAC